MAQQTNIVYLLLCHLNQHLWFEIPGIGIFNGKKSVAYLNHLENKIYPGNLSIEFQNANTLRTEAMIQNMVSETGYDQELLEEHLAALCQFINESIKANAYFHFEPFGVLSSHNEILVFEQGENNIHQDFYWMEALPISPVEMPHKEVPIPNEKIPIVKTKSKRELVILLIALGILWLIFLNLLFCPPASKSHTKESLNPIHDTTNSSAFLDTIKLPQVSTYVQDTMLEQNKLDSIHTNKDTSNPFIHEAVIDSINVKELNEKIKNKPCIIIVGSFIKLSNMQNLANKISKDGFKVYRGEYGKFHRVGIEFNCFEHDLREMLAELKKKYHPGAWVLKF